MNPKKKIRVMIVEDSPVVSALLEYSIGRDPRLEVCAIAASAEDALDTFEEISPDVIAMDIRLPGMDGLEATRRIMSSRPIPIVVVAASVESGKWNSTPMEALRAGALSVLEKPVGTTHADYDAVSERLCTQLVIMSQVKLVKQHGNRESYPWESGALRFGSPELGTFKMLGIVCSTGGPGALVKLLTGLGPAVQPCAWQRFVRSCLTSSKQISCIGGIFRRVRFALAYRTGPLNLFIRDQGGIVQVVGVVFI